MNRKTPRTRPLTWFYLFLIVICLAGLTAGANTVSSSRSFNYDPANGTNDRRWETELLYQGGTGDIERLFLQGPTSKIAPQVIEDTADGKSTSVVILLADQADVSAAYGMKDQDARGWFVYNTLTEHAARTQTGIKAVLESRGISYQSFWAANMLVALADRPTVDLLAARSDVARVDSNKPARWIEDPDVANFGVRADSPEAVEWGVANVNAPAVWALGFTGQGMIVANQDTGMRWSHAAIKGKYRGWNGVSADHNFNWHDSIHSGGGSCGANAMAPCDDHGHGTHTTGTTVGDDGGTNQVGVAPGAKWIGCRNMDQGNGTPATYSECFQFFIAPTDLTGSNPNPALRPHVMNNSWGCPGSEGCTTRAELETIVNNTQAAGIFVEVSAGNSGPGCSSVSDAPAIYGGSFSTGAIDISNTLASFSSRGPSTFYTPNLRKPNLSAPGVSVRSSSRTSDISYDTFSGTSMAGPHVVGVVALLWSARPNLVRDIATTKSILQISANPAVIVSPQTCGGTASTQIPNNSFGYGRVDALAAVNASPTAGASTLSGRIATSGGSAVEGTIVKLGGDQSRTTVCDDLGNYRFENVYTGNFYTVTPALSNYTFSPASRSFSLTGNVTNADFTANPDATQTSNAIDITEFFVRQHYRDFLNREPDQGGLDYWSAQINPCGADANCISNKRIDVSAAFFASDEFQQTGSYVYDVYAATLGRTLNYGEFLVDRGQVLGGANLNQAKTQFAQDFVQRSEFINRYPAGMTREEFVDAILLTMQQRSGIDPSSLRNGFLSDYDTGGRPLVVRHAAEASAFVAAEYNKAYVLMQYYGYLRRDIDPGGYAFWLNILNGGASGRGMVCSFITSTEYQHRFSQIVTHSNAECP
jgi:serine protease AprX